MLADSLRHEHRHWRSLAVPSPLLAELRALTRDRERLVWNQRDTENQLRAIVQVYHPGVLHLFSSLDRDIPLAFLRDYPTPAHAGGAQPVERVVFQQPADQRLAGRADLGSFLPAPGRGAHVEGDLLRRVIGQVGLLALRLADVGLDQVPAQEQLHHGGGRPGVEGLPDVLPRH